MIACLQIVEDLGSSPSNQPIVIITSMPDSEAYHVTSLANRYSVNLNNRGRKQQNGNSALYAKLKFRVKLY